MRKIRMSAFLGIIFILVAIVSASNNGGVLKAEFKPPKDIAKYIPSGFTIDEQHSGTKDYGMYVATNVLATKANTLPYPFTSPAKANLELGQVKFADASMANMAWQDALQHAEKNSKIDTAVNYRFVGKENTRGGGVLYWYQGGEIKPQYDDKGGYKLDFYKIEFITKVSGGVLTVKIEDLVAEKDTIRSWFQ